MQMAYYKNAMQIVFDSTT